MEHAGRDRLVNSNNREGENGKIAACDRRGGKGTEIQ